MEKQKQMTEQEFRNISLYTDTEMELIKTTFSNKGLILSLRKFMWQQPINKAERNNVGHLSKSAIKLLRETFIPTLGSMETLEQMKDIWLFDFETTMPQYAMQLFKVRDLVGRYFNQVFSELEGDEMEDKIDFAKLSDFRGKTDEEAYIDMSARNMIARETQRYLCLLFLLAQPVKTPDQIKEEAVQNSNK